MSIEVIPNDRVFIYQDFRKRNRYVVEVFSKNEKQPLYRRVAIGEEELSDIILEAFLMSN